MTDLRRYFGAKASAAAAGVAAAAAVARSRSPKRPRLEQKEVSSAAGEPGGVRPTLQDPRRIITWNANGFMARVSSSEDLAAFQALIRKHDPDIICLQEARVKAHCSDPKAKVSSQVPRDRSRPMEAELQGALRAALRSSPLGDYSVLWSLANGRAAGTAIFLHHRLGCAEGSVASSLQDALILSGCSQAPKKGQHHPEGRIQYVRLKGFDLLNTYVPNNGWVKERHAERRRWDEEMEAFLHDRDQTRPLIWCGDLNVAHRPEDSTSEEVFRNEWDRDSKRFASKEEYMQATPENDQGIPGFSNNERSRFDRLLAAGGLSDAWRRLHPATDPKPEPGDAAFTWRGTQAVQARFRARYEGMAQRLDYFLLSEALLPRLVRCEILGRGADRQGFLGSDHCPVLLELQGGGEEEPSTGEARTEVIDLG